MCSCGKLVIRCKEASKGLMLINQEAKKEVFADFIQDFKDILENYRGDYFKININRFNELKEKWQDGGAVKHNNDFKKVCPKCKGEPIIGTTKRGVNVICGLYEGTGKPIPKS